MRAFSPVTAVLRGKRPETPLDAESLGLSGTLWELVQSCWSESSSGRPTVRRLFDYLSPAALAWVPPPVYPTIVIGTEGIADSNSSSLLRVLLASSTRWGRTGDSTEGPVVPIFAFFFLFLSLCILSKSILFVPLYALVSSVVATYSLARDA